MAAFYSDLQFDLDYKTLPNRIDEEDLERRVIALKLGDFSQVQEISIRLMRLAMSLVANFAHPRRTPDLIGVALLALVESVNNAATKLVDNNIIPYVSSNITHRLIDAINKEHIVNVKNRKLKALPVVPLPDIVAKPDRVSLECREMLEKIIRNDNERLLVELRSQKQRIKLISEMMGVSVRTVHLMRRELQERYHRLSTSNL